MPSCRKIPYMLVVGDKEAAEEAVAVRTRENEDRGAMPLAAFISHTANLITTKSLDL